MVVSTLENPLIRTPTLEDAEIVAALANLCAQTDEGEQAISEPAEIRREWQTPGFNLETDIRLVFSPGGALVGYVETWDSPPHVRVWQWGRVHPEWRGRGIGTYLVQFGEERARQAIPKAPPEARVYISSGADSRNQGAKALFEQKGYSLVRHFWRMRIDFTEPPTAPVLPEGITIRTFVPGQDDRATFDAMEDAFMDHWGFLRMPYERWRHFTIDKEDFDPSLYFLAVDGGEIAGIALCEPKITEDPDMGWVDDLAVRRAWRRRGLGLALLRHAFVELYKRGRPRAGLGVDAASLTGATRLYERAGMRADKQWDRYEKELRPGVELSTQTLE